MVCTQRWEAACGRRSTISLTGDEHHQHGPWAMRQVILSSFEVVDDTVEVVERKGLGHPDTICDAIAEALPRSLCHEYRQRFRAILHHNVDKALLCGGSAAPAFGGGTVTRRSTSIWPVGPSAGSGPKSEVDSTCKHHANLRAEGSAKGELIFALAGVLNRHFA